MFGGTLRFCGTPFEKRRSKEYIMKSNVKSTFCDATKISDLKTEIKVFKGE